MGREEGREERTGGTGRRDGTGRGKVLPGSIFAYHNFTFITILIILSIGIEGLRNLHPSPGRDFMVARLPKAIDFMVARLPKAIDFMVARL